MDNRINNDGNSIHMGDLKQTGDVMQIDVKEIKDNKTKAEAATALETVKKATTEAEAEAEAEAVTAPATPRKKRECEYKEWSSEPTEVETMLAGFWGSLSHNTKNVIITLAVFIIILFIAAGVASAFGW